MNILIFVIGFNIVWYLRIIGFSYIYVQKEMGIVEFWIPE